MANIDLGFAEDCEPWQLESYMFPNKIGGKPAWLDLEDLPKPEDLQCPTCHQPMIFLCQIYAPYEEDDSNFHRTLFVFICKNAECCTRNSSSHIKVFRNSLERSNKFYSFDPPNEDRPDLTFAANKWVDLCNICGCLANKHCSKCKRVAYCCREHQVIDWKEGHKNECEKCDDVQQRVSSLLFPQNEILIESEEQCRTIRGPISEHDAMEKYKQLAKDGLTGTMQDISEAELEQHCLESDKAFNHFRKATQDNPDQILRYSRGGEPLWIAEEPKPTNVPNCEVCNGERQFEFEIMPQMLSILNEHALDWGVIAVYTCKKSCRDKDGYISEFVFKQDVAINDLE